MKLFAALLAGALALPVAARADEDRAAFAWQQKQGAEVPLGTTFRDEADHEVTLGSLIGRAPVILDLGYFHCPSLCGVVRADLFHALSDSGLQPGRDYTLVSLSIDPAETPVEAKQAKAVDLTQAAVKTDADWHYLTGSPATINAVAVSVGFHDHYDTRFGQFLHPAGLVLLTRAGTVSGYLLGVGYSSGELRAAVAVAGDGRVRQAALPILLLCFHYDPATGRYTLAIEKVLKVMAVITVLSMVGIFVLLNRTKRLA